MTAPPGPTDTSIILIGADGSRWDLLSPTSPVTAARGIGGLHLPAVTQQWTDMVGKPGSTWRGSQMAPRRFTMNLLVGDRTPPYRTGGDWRNLDGTFWAAMSTEESSSLIVNGKRRLRFRLDGDNEFDFAMDPSIHGKATYPINCIADWPLWQGDPINVSFPWVPEVEVNYYGDVAGVGPLFFISRANLFTTAMIANPGDFPSWATWTINGAVGVASVGVGDDIISLPFALNDADVVIIDTAEETIVDSFGDNLWPRMGYAPVPMAPIPPGDMVPIRIGMEDPAFGAGVVVTLIPQFRRAWGATPGADISLPIDDDTGLGVEGLGSGSLGG